MKRVLSVWLPTFRTDRLCRTDMPYTAWRDRPFAVTGQRSGGIRLAAINSAAAAEGLGPGMPLADARALVPGLKTVAEDLEADRDSLRRLADWCGHFTPWIREEALNPDMGDGSLWLDVSGCAHLFGGEDALLDSLITRLGRLQLNARAGLADTPGAAWAAARYLTGHHSPHAGPHRPDVQQDGSVNPLVARIPGGAQRQLLSSLPPAALRLSAVTLDSLERLGLHQIDALLALPRGPLVKRFGQDTARRLDQALGRLPEPINPHRPLPPQSVRMGFAEPIGRQEDIATALNRLLATLCEQMRAQTIGARALELQVFRVDGSVARATVGTARPDRTPHRLARLFAGRLDRLDLGFGVEALSLALLASDPLTAQQTSLATGGKTGVPSGTRESLVPKSAALPPQRETATEDEDLTALAVLVDSLSARLGTDAVQRPDPAPSHRPERRWMRRTPFSAPPAMAARIAATDPRTGPSWSGVQPGQPVRLYRRPVATDPRGYPRADAPQHVAPEWWRESGAQDAPTPAKTCLDSRWIRAETADGSRLWLRQSTSGTTDPWQVHGACP